MAVLRRAPDSTNRRLGVRDKCWKCWRSSLDDPGTSGVLRAGVEKGVLSGVEYGVWCLRAGDLKGDL